MSNIEKIRQEIERRIKSCDATSKTPNQLLWAELSALLPFLDSLEEEPIEGLDEAAKEAATEVYTYTFQGMDDLIGLFKAGAEWQKEQMMKDAVEGEVHHCMSVHYVVTNENQLAEALKRFNDGDKVRIIIVKEDGE